MLYSYEDRFSLRNISVEDSISMLRPTISFDPQGGTDECKQRGVEHDCAVTVQGHVHGDQTLKHTT